MLECFGFLVWWEGGFIMNIDGIRIINTNFCTLLIIIYKLSFANYYLLNVII